MRRRWLCGDSHMGTMWQQARKPKARAARPRPPRPANMQWCNRQAHGSLNGPRLRAAAGGSASGRPQTSTSRASPLRVAPHSRSVMRGPGEQEDGSIDEVAQSDKPAPLAGEELPQSAPPRPPPQGAERGACAPQTSIICSVHVIRLADPQCPRFGRHRVHVPCAQTTELAWEELGFCQNKETKHMRVSRGVGGVMCAMCQRPASAHTEAQEALLSPAVGLGRTARHLLSRIDKNATPTCAGGGDHLRAPLAGLGRGQAAAAGRAHSQVGWRPRRKASPATKWHTPRSPNPAASSAQTFNWALCPERL